MDLFRTAHNVCVRLPDGAALPLVHFIGVGRNYAEHAREQGAEVPDRPLIFSKSPSSACLSGDDILIPRACHDRPQVDYEGELAVVIARPCRDATEDTALSFVLGCCVANDVSARWWQRHGAGGQFNRGKSFDTFCPLGPRLTPMIDIPDIQALRLETRVNGALVQSDTTASMLFPVAQLIADLSQGATLAPGFVILTGTPSGVGMAMDPPKFLDDGDEVVISIERLGEIRNTVRLER